MVAVLSAVTVVVGFTMVQCWHLTTMLLLSQSIFDWEHLDGYTMKTMKFMAIWDIMMKNIAKFGGDPNKITLFGESIGAILTMCYLLDSTNNASSSLITGVIVESNPLGVKLRTPEDWIGMRSDFYHHLSDGNITKAMLQNVSG